MTNTLGSRSRRQRQAAAWEVRVCARLSRRRSG